MAKNRLSAETSPYLLQHADNPVFWQPWSDEVFARAKDENKLVFLSIGYSTCHWCHVMAHESFEDEAAADILNEHFICVKVDREERPDIDATYMSYLQLTTGHGGWPMSLWLSPNGKPIVGGTYFPLEDKEGRIGFKNACLQIADLWRTDPERALKGAEEVFSEMQRRAEEVKEPVLVDFKSTVTKTITQFESQFDNEEGGFGNAPKFPRPVTLDFLSFAREQSLGEFKLESLKEMHELTLQKMSSGGMYDQLAGGFHRYSVDGIWHVPHFEKMLYDQAQLLYAYTEAWAVHGYDGLSEITQTLEYLKSVLLSKEGAYFSGEDADSVAQNGKKLEGAYWVWTSEEIFRLIEDPKEAAILCAYFGIQHGGNVDPSSDPHGDLFGKNILFKAVELEYLIEKFEVDRVTIEEIIERGRTTLLAVRFEREAPHKDDKIITAWNAYLLKAFSYLAFRTQDPEHKELAVQLKNAIAQHLWNGNVLYRSMREGRAEVAGFAQDYVALIEALLFYKSIDGSATVDEWIHQLAEQLEQQFWDEKRKAFTLSLGLGGEELFSLVEDYDGAEPSTCALALGVYSRLAVLYPERSYAERLIDIRGMMVSVATDNGFVSPAVAREYLVELQGRRLIKIGSEVESEVLLNAILQMKSSDQIQWVSGKEIVVCAEESCQPLI